MTEPLPARAIAARQIDELDKMIGQRLRHLRETQGLSQQAVATICGLSFQQIQKYERGINRISAVRLQQFATIYRVPLTRLLSGLDDRDSAEPSVTTAQVSEAALKTRLYAASVRLPRPALEHLVGLAEHIAAMQTGPA